MDLKKYDLVLLNDSINELGMRLDDHQIDQLIQYYELLIEWNRFMNLTAITEWNDVCTKHFIDSMSLCKAEPRISLSPAYCGSSLICVCRGQLRTCLPCQNTVFPM